MARFFWTQKQDIGPPPCRAHGMAYDITRSRTVLFGGYSDLFNQKGGRGTWEWDGDYWTEMNDMGPSARGFHSLVFDSLRRRTVCFGGIGLDGITLGDTWEWDGEDWTQMADTGPAARGGAATVFDADRNRVVLFGGVDNALHTLRDTWEWDGAEWTQVDDTGPSARALARAAYNPGRRAITLFGGLASTSASGDVLSPGDTWERSNGVWKQVNDIGPGAMELHAMVFNGGGVVLFAPDGATWEWDGSHWTKRQDMGPGARLIPEMAYDSGRDKTVLFGGMSAVTGVLGDTWELVERTVSAPGSLRPE